MDPMRTTAAPPTADIATPFTARDVMSHTMTVWAAFVVPSAVYLVFAFWDGFGVSGAVGMFLFIVFAFAVITLVLALLGAPLAWLLGRALRRVTRSWVHLVAFGLLGAIAGAVVTATPIIYWVFPNADALFAAGVAAVCGLCTAFGRWLAFHLRRRRKA